MQLITGRTGVQHVAAADDAEIIRTLLGDGDFILSTGRQLSANMNGAYELDVYDGTAIMQGRQCKIKAGEGYNKVTLDNGVSGYMRWDVVVLEYSKSGDLESAELKVIKGENRKSYAEPVVPHLKGNIDNGETHQMKLWGVKYNGVNFDSLVDYRVILNTTPINTALDSVNAMHESLREELAKAKKEVDEKISEIEGLGKTVPHFVAEETNIRTEEVTTSTNDYYAIRISKPSGYVYEKTDVFDLYLNGLMCRPSTYDVISAGSDIDVTGDAIAKYGQYDEVVLKIWKAVE